MSTITSAIKNFIADEDGVTAIEYGLIAALVGIGIAAAAGTLGENLSTLFDNIGDELGVSTSGGSGGAAPTNP